MSTSLNQHHTITVVVVDDHKVILQGLALMLGNEGDIRLCATAEDACSGLEAIREHQPDVAIVDISLQDKNGIELIKDIVAQYPHTEILVLSTHNETVYAERTINAGALGYIMKTESLDKVVDGIRAVHNKQLFVSDKVESQLLQQSIKPVSACSALPISKLSDRELEVFTLIGQGNRPRHISEQLNMSPRSVSTYCTRIREKLNLKSMDELIPLAADWVQAHS